MNTKTFYRQLAFCESELQRTREKVIHLEKTVEYLHSLVDLNPWPEPHKGRIYGNTYKAAVLEVLRAAGKPLRIGEIYDLVVAKPGQEHLSRNSLNSQVWRDRCFRRVASGTYTLAEETPEQAGPSSS